MRSQRWRRICIVSGCGQFQVANSRCGKHAREYEAARGTRHERGYGATHDADRVRLLAKLKLDETHGITQLCWRCLEPMSSTQELDADHSTIRASAGGRADCLTHAPCNRGKRTPS
jgi:hypothetical protein